MDGGRVKVVVDILVGAIGFFSNGTGQRGRWSYLD